LNLKRELITTCLNCHQPTKISKLKLSTMEETNKKQKEKHFDQTFEKIMDFQISTNHLFIQTFENEIKKTFREEMEFCRLKGNYILKKEEKEILKNWLFEHSSHPYPTMEEKKELLRKTRLTAAQLSIWLANGRQRFLGGRKTPPHVKRVKLFTEELEKNFNDQK
jgi:hypothetical protein